MIRSRVARLARPLGLVAGLGLVAILAAGCVGGFGVGRSETFPPSPAPTGEPVGSGACPTSQPAPLPTGQKRTLTIDTPKGTIVVVIDGSLSPVAAGNLVALAACGYYDGVVFHRLVPGFVIQGGDGQYGRVGADGKLANPSAVGTGGPGYTIKDEPVTAKYGRGVVAMARGSDPDSVGSQFFIVLDDQAASALASYNTYQIVGKVTSGMDVVDTIAAMPNSGDPDNAALDPVPMTKVTVSQ